MLQLFIAKWLKGNQVQGIMGKGLPARLVALPCDPGARESLAAERRRCCRLEVKGGRRDCFAQTRRRVVILGFSPQPLAWAWIRSRLVPSLFKADT
jgi:hypothetical protein